ncbi:hypothetical protein [Cellulomonas denverensis]|uniref:Uncharacterized protein n=1 Tax=Cellulomonas denverensis TaxID=264297 RepID=A0A7X6KVT0_9CELL|nr:hypothetical protein [Cellulomonas denverensis]NKY23221.1 hypothetical protein [Cellulomonas denverensis]
MAVSLIGLLFSPESAGYLLFSLPVAMASGAVAGTACGALAAAIAPFARKSTSLTRALLQCSALYAVALSVAATILVVVFVSADWVLTTVSVVVVVIVLATGLAIWGFALEWRRARRAAYVWPHTARHPR